MLYFKTDLIVEDRVVWKGWVMDQLEGSCLWLKNTKMQEHTWVVPVSTHARGRHWGWRPLEKQIQ